MNGVANDLVAPEILTVDAPCDVCNREADVRLGGIAPRTAEPDGSAIVEEVGRVSRHDGGRRAEEDDTLRELRLRRRRTADEEEGCEGEGGWRRM